LPRGLRRLGKPGQQWGSPLTRLLHNAHAGRASLERPDARRGNWRDRQRRTGKRLHIDRQVDTRKRRSLPLPKPIPQMNRPDFFRLQTRP
jgi:hypothetical protein